MSKTTRSLILYMMLSLAINSPATAATIAPSPPEKPEQKRTTTQPTTPAAASQSPKGGGTAGSTNPAAGKTAPPPREVKAAPPGSSGSNLNQAEKQSGKKPDTFTIKAAVPNSQRLALKYGKHFMLLNESGNASEDNPYGFGLYRDDTRYLNTWDVRLNGEPMVLLYANTQDGYAGRFVYSNPPNISLGAQRILVEREILLNDHLREHIHVTNFDSLYRSVNLSITYGSDFADMFEIRGQKRAKRGLLAPPLVSPFGQRVTLSYQGLDHQTMKTYIGFSRRANTLDTKRAVWQITFDPRETWDLDVVAATNFNEPVPKLFENDPAFADQKKAADAAYADWRKDGADIVSDNVNFNNWIEKGWRDLYILRQPTPKGNCIAAGIPWFTVAFGRDQEITALETTPFRTDLSQDVLKVLAGYQGTKEEAATEEEPGKMIHELRLGEMARLREIPFIPYYGTIDATPLWLVLLGRYVQCSGDLEFARGHWDTVEAALAYLDAHTKDGGYLRYGGKKRAPLSNQGWKDSYDSIMDHSGKLAKAPIAVCEAQGYVYAAWKAAARLADGLGKADEARALNARADAFQAKFQKDFWNEDLGFIALALDADNKQCDVVASNPGHLLFTGILSPAEQKAVAERLLQPDMFSGWGIRTLSSKEVAYNPLSYHDGSVWPHDNAMIAGGLADPDVKHSDYANQVLSALFAVAQKEPDMRLPELFCGFPKDYADKPVAYPVSCSPQAWAAGSVFLALQAALGLSVDAQSQSVHVRRPCLPDGVARLAINNLRIGAHKADLLFTRTGDRVNCQIKSEDGVTTSVETTP